MMKLLLLFLISKNIFASTSCELTSYAEIIVTDVKMAQIDPAAFISSSNCEQDIQNTFKKLIVNSSGELKSKQINFILADKFPNHHIRIAPVIISVNDLNTFIKKFLKLEANLEATNANFINKKSYVNCDNAHIKTSEANIERTGSKNLALQCDQQEIWVNTNILRHRNALVVEETIPAFSVIENQFVTNKQVLISDEANLFEDIDTISFYKTGKPIAKGEVLTTNHLVPVKLTSYGKEAQLFVRSKNVVVKSLVISRGTGSINEIIEAYNPINKKKVNAKITGFNELTIEL